MSEQLTLEIEYPEARKCLSPQNNENFNWEEYHNHVMRINKTGGTLGLVYDILFEMTDRRGLIAEWDDIDSATKDDIVKKWCGIINKWLEEKEKK